MAVDVHSGKQRLILTSADFLILPTWLPDGHGLLVQNRTRASNFTQRQIAYVVYPEGESIPSPATPTTIPT